MINVVRNHFGKILYLILSVVFLYCLILGAILLFHLKFRFGLVSCLPNCSGAYLVGISPEITTWNGISMADVELDHADLSGANLSNADLSAMDLSGINFSQANLSQANLSNSRLEQVNLQGADLSNADLSQARFVKVDLSKATFVQANLRQANLEKINLAQAQFIETDLEGANLQDAYLKEASFKKVNLQKANLLRAYLEDAEFEEVDLSEANLCDVWLAQRALPLDNRWYLYGECKGQVLTPLTSCQEARERGLINDDDTFFCLQSERGDWLGEGKIWIRTAVDGNISIRKGIYNDNDIWLDFGDKSRNRGVMGFGAPSDKDLIPGIYEKATRLPFNAPTEPGLDVGFLGKGCNKLFGRFEILEVEYDSAGNVERLAVNFEHHCNTPSKPALFGYLRFNSKIPL